jgi:hypothetical protein
MAASIQNHVHLDTDDPPTATYKAEHGSLDTTPAVAVVTERALTGKLHTHRLLSGAEPVQFRSDALQIRATLAQMLTLRGLAGKRVYYAPHYHDDDENGAGSLKAWSASSLYVNRVVLTYRPGSLVNRNPAADLWLVTIEMVDDNVS